MTRDLSNLRSLLQELAALPFGPPHKPDPCQNLTDMLEVEAVASGLKPAHLQGQGFRSEAVLQGLEQLMPRYGLRTLRTPSVRSYRHRSPDYDPGIAAWEEREARTAQAAAPNVLWVYVDPALDSLIHEAVRGACSAATVLGYPKCCAARRSELEISIAETYVHAIFEQCAISTPEQCIHLQQENVSVDATLPHDTKIEPSLRVFPYVQFSACPDCMRRADSPAGVINRRMRDLAFEVDPRFGKAIWRARDAVVFKGMVQTYSRNGPCPCGSGAKYKKCCGVLPD